MPAVSVSYLNRLSLFVGYDRHLPDMRKTLPSFYLLAVLRNRSFTFIFIGLLISWGRAYASIPQSAAAPAALTLVVSTATVCAGTSATLTASGCPAGGTLRWSTTQTGSVISVAPKQTTSYTAICEVTSTTVVSTTAASSTATSTTAIVTTVTATTATATVRVIPPIVAKLDTIPPMCNGTKDGMVVINASGGAGVLQYQFNGQPFQTINTFGALRAGTYPIVVKDTAGCLLQTSVNLTQPPALSASVTVVNTKCVGGSDGAISVVASGGSGNYRYSLDNVTGQQTDGIFQNLKAETEYTLIVSDKHTCVLYKSITVGQATPFTIKLTPQLTRCVGSADGSVAISVSGGSGAYQYKLGNGPFQTGAQFTGLAAGTYEFTVLDNIGCQGKQSTTIGQPTPLVLTASTTPVTCLGPTTGSIKVGSTGGTGALTYQISGQTLQGAAVFSGVAVGTYTIVGTDANGCTSLASATVGKVNPVKVQASSLPAACCSCATGVVSLTATGGTGTGLQFQVIGRPLQADSQIGQLTPNTYRLRVVDDGGCSDSTTAVVINQNPLSLSVGTVNNISCTGGLDGEATVLVKGGTKPFTYYWQTERQDTLKNYAAKQTAIPEGTYTVSVRDSNRCTAPTVFVTIKSLNPVPPRPVVTAVGNSTLTVNQTTGIQWYVQTGASPGTPVPNATGPALVPFASGQYYVVTTANGCASLPSEALNFVLTALNEPVQSLSVRVVPNPITDRLRLEIEQPERSTVQVEMLDVSGRVVRQFQLPAFTGKKQAEWPLNGVPTGTYLLKIATGSRQSVLRVGVE